MLPPFCVLTEIRDYQEVLKQENILENYISSSALIIVQSRSLYCDILQLERLRNDLVPFSLDSQVTYINMARFWPLWPICKGNMQNPVCRIFPTHLDGFPGPFIFTWRGVCRFGTSACSLDTYLALFSEGRHFFGSLKFYQGVIWGHRVRRKQRRKLRKWVSIHLTPAWSIAVPLFSALVIEPPRNSLLKGKKEFHY